MALGKLETALSGSDKPYLGAQMRVLTGTSVRLQWPGFEGSFGISEALTAYLVKLPAPNVSLAHTSAMYFPCQVAMAPTGGLRVAVPGPEYNRPWGALFDTPQPSIGARAGAAILALSPSKPDAEGTVETVKPPEVPAPDAEPEPDMDDDED